MTSAQILRRQFAAEQFQTEGSQWVLVVQLDEIQLRKRTFTFGVPFKGTQIVILINLFCADLCIMCVSRVRHRQCVPNTVSKTSH